MRLPSGPLIQVEQCPSTQDLAADLLRSGEPVGIVVADHQTGGRGRFDRKWLSGPGDSLTASFAFDAYADHPRPHLIGMTLAAAVAGALHCQLQWPNDLVLLGKKLGGILTEIVPDPAGRKVPIVGLGLNLNQETFPDELSGATSLRLARGHSADPRAVLQRVTDRVELLPEPHQWSDLEPSWMLFDTTPGKKYKLQDSREAVAIRIGPEGQLLCAVDGESTTVLAADAIFGT